LTCELYEARNHMLQLCTHHNISRYDSPSASEDLYSAAAALAAATSSDMLLLLLLLVLLVVSSEEEVPKRALLL